MHAAGARATPEHPLAWVAMEPDRSTAEQVVSVACWPGDGTRDVVATAHAHAARVKPGPREAADGGIVPPDPAKAVRSKFAQLAREQWRPSPHVLIWGLWNRPPPFMTGPPSTPRTSISRGRGRAGCR